MAAEDQAVVATVGGEAIYAQQVQRLLDRVTAGKEVGAAVLPWMKAGVLAEAVDRRLVLAYARRTGSAAKAEEIDKAIAELRILWSERGSSLEEELRKDGSTPGELRRQIEGKLTWQKYLVRYVTDARVQSYFDAHRREFDGTRLVVSQILLASAGQGTATAELIERAQAIRREITAGEISFAEAARTHSAGPSGKQGGRLGPIERHGSMSESFSRAAFALEAGQVSEPVRTPFGVHLIRCDGIEPGGKQLSDVRPQVEEALAAELLDKLAEHERRHTAVEYTDAWPHFKPGTRELVQE